MTKISVIIPVYNVEKYLRRCLDSVINQTLKDIEIICVNDCSPDNSIDILREYELKDNRIKVIDFKENKGVSAARNTGIKEAKGEYIGFVDSDDYIDLDFYEKLYIKAVECRAEIVIGNILDNSFKAHKDLYKKIASNKINFNGIFYVGIYKTKLLDDYKINFIEDISYGEDRLFPVKSAYYSNSLEIIYDTFYHYERRNDSVTKSRISEKKTKDFMISVNMLLDFINGTDIDKDNYTIIAETFIKQVFEFLVNLDNDTINKCAFYDFLLNVYDRVSYKANCRIQNYENLFSLIKNNETEKLINLLKIRLNKKTFDGLRRQMMIKKGN